MSEAIAKFAYRHWMRHGMTEWPRVRHVARSLNVSQKEIAECEGNDYELTGYRDDDPLGDLFVEADLPEVELAWCEYWRPFSRGCCCGQHLIVAELPGT